MATARPVTRSMARTEGVRLIDRMATTDDDDPLTSPLQAAAAHALRRSLSIALAMGEAFSGQTGLVELKKANLENRLPAARASEFTELLADEALVVLSVFATKNPVPTIGRCRNARSAQTAA